MRRTALDGIIDWRYFFATGKNPMTTEQFTPGMIESITAMLREPEREERVWQYTTFHPTAEKDIIPKREGLNKEDLY